MSSTSNPSRDLHTANFVITSFKIMSLEEIFSSFGFVRPKNRNLILVNRLRVVVCSFIRAVFASSIASLTLGWGFSRRDITFKRERPHSIICLAMDTKVGGSSNSLYAAAQMPNTASSICFTMFGVRCKRTKWHPRSSELEYISTSVKLDVVNCWSPLTRRNSISRASDDLRMGSSNSLKLGHSWWCETKRETQRRLLLERERCGDSPGVSLERVRMPA
ncbi:hypothetical protein DFS33DRAFT_853333 [Desarmillaria ectypa]|nr:hypothetical protein DFS33DRAFT_853333 [Desarmillaria ectypa]